MEIIVGYQNHAVTGHMTKSIPESKIPKIPQLCLCAIKLKTRWLSHFSRAPSSGVLLFKQPNDDPQATLQIWIHLRGFSNFTNSCISSEFLNLFFFFPFPNCGLFGGLFLFFQVQYTRPGWSGLYVTNHIMTPVELCSFKISWVIVCYEYILFPCHANKFVLTVCHGPSAFSSLSLA